MGIIKGILNTMGIPLIISQKSMENTNYITIQGWMINELNLKGNELLLYAIIYGFSQDGDSEYFGSQRYIAKAMKISLQTANKIINNLLDKGLIEKIGESHYRVSCAKLVDKNGGVFKKLERRCSRNLNRGVQESRTNKYNTNYNTNNIYISSKSKICKESNKVNDLIGLFYENINPNIKFENKTIRKDADFLINHYPFEKLEAMVMYIKEHKSEQYFPSVSTPSQLREKMSAIINHYNKSKNNSPKLIKI